MKRVLLTVHKFFPDHKAGTEVLTLKVAQNLISRGFEVLVVSANPPDLDARHKSETDTSDYVYEGVAVHSVEESLRLKGYNFRHEFYHDSIKNHFTEVIASFQPDLVHIFHCQNLTASIIDAAVQSKIPVVCSLTDFWFVCPVVQLKRRDGSLCRGPEQGARNCLTCYTPELIPPADQLLEAVQSKFSATRTFAKNAPPAIKKISAKILQIGYSAVKLKSAVAATVERPEVLRRLLNKTKSVMIPTALMRDIFIENGINSELIEHVPFGLDTSQLTNHQTKSKSSTVRVGFIGTIFEHKGLDLLIKAFQELAPDSSIELNIFGDLNQFPAYGDEIKELAERSPAHRSKIKFRGTFPNSQLGTVLENLDVLVVPSRWYENTPLVIQSSLATKTPVIATNLGGMSELIKHDQNGLLFNLNDHKSLAEQLKRLLTEPNLLTNLSDNIGTERTVEQMVDDIVDVYERVLSSEIDQHLKPTNVV